MPGPGLKVALATGNWSSPALWDAGVLPIAGDTVCANGFTVTIDQTVNVAQLSTAAFTNTGQTVAMTSNTTPAGYVAAASSATGGGEAYRAFAKDANLSVWATINNNTGWISYQFPSAIVIDRYSIMGAPSLARSPNTWTFEGSNDGVTWTPLHSVSGSTIPAATWYNSPLLGNVTAYTRYRVNVTAVGTLNNPVSISEIYLYEVGYTTVSGAAGGGFTCSTSQTITCTASLGVVGGSSTCLTFTGASPAALVVNANVTSGIGNNTSGILHSGTGTVTVNGTIRGSEENNTSNYGCRLTGAGVFNINGNVFQNFPVSSSASTWAMLVSGIGGTLNIVGNLYTTTNGNAAGIINITANATVNITGDIICQLNNGTGWSTLGVQATVPCTINLTGNIYTGQLTSPSTINYGISTGAFITLYITGNLYAGYGPSGDARTYGSACLNHTGTPNIVNVIGIIANAHNGGGGNIISLIAGGTPILSGPFLCSSGGLMPISLTGGRMRLNVSAVPNTYFTFTSSALGNPFVTLYTATALADAPVPANVRSGVVYALGSQTGTLVVPPAGSVANGVVYDNGTIGTAVLTPAGVWDALTSTMTTPGSIGERLKNASTVATTGSQLAAFTS